MNLIRVQVDVTGSSAVDLIRVHAGESIRMHSLILSQGVTPAGQHIRFFSQTQIEDVFIPAIGGTVVIPFSKDGWMVSCESESISVIGVSGQAFSLAISFSYEKVAQWN